MIYVDKIFCMESSNPQAKRVGSRTGHKWCHMWADDVDELHAIAKTIGMKRSWFQNKPTLQHYDLTPNKRALAIKNGAVEVSITRFFRMRHTLGEFF